MIQFILMVLISILAGIIAAGTVWLAMDFIPKLAATLRAWKAKRALDKAAGAMEGEGDGAGEEGAANEPEA